VGPVACLQLSLCGLRLSARCGACCMPSVVSVWSRTVSCIWGLLHAFNCAVELYCAPHLWHPPFYTSPMASSALVLSNIEPPALQRKAATDKLVEKIVKHDSWLIQPDILNPPLLRLTSRKLLWLDLQPVHIKNRWRHNWKSVQVVNSHLVCNPTI